MDNTLNNGNSCLPLRLGVAGNWLAYVHTLKSAGLRDIILRDAAVVAEAGFNAIELTIAHCDPFIAQLPFAFWEDVGGMLRDMDVEPISVHGPYYPTLDRDLEVAIPQLIHHARAACALGVRGFVVHPVYHSHLHVTEFADRAYEWDRRISLEISDAIGGSGTYLAIENTPHHSFNGIERLLHAVDRKNVGMCFDTGHYHVRPEQTLTQTLERFGRWIVHVHLTDNDGFSDQHLPPDEGTFDWDTFFSCIDMTQLNHGLLIELSPPIDMHVGNVAPQATRELFQHARKSVTPVLDKCLPGYTVNQKGKP